MNKYISKAGSVIVLAIGSVGFAIGLFTIGIIALIIYTIAVSYYRIVSLHRKIVARKYSITIK